MGLASGVAGNIYDEYFDVIEASSSSLLDQIFALRYQVYCVEHPFQDPARNPGFRETDEWDEEASKIALVYRPTRELAGTVRFIRPSRRLPHLPIEAVLLRQTQLLLASYARTNIGEISRYAIAKSFRRRDGEGEFPDVSWTAPEQAGRARMMPHLTAGLIRGVLATSRAADVQVLCACVRPALRRILSRLGLQFSTLGPIVDYHGTRQPCLGMRDELLAGLKATTPDLIDLVDRQVLPDISVRSLE